MDPKAFDGDPILYRGWMTAEAAQLPTYGIEVRFESIAHVECAHLRCDFFATFLPPIPPTPVGSMV